MTVFLAHAPADGGAAEAAERALERRGLFVERDDGHAALHPVEGGDALILFVSHALARAAARLRLEQRALDAWALGRLVIVRLDDADAPVGLRDLPAVDARDPERREASWSELAGALAAPARPVGAVRGAFAPKWLAGAAVAAGAAAVLLVGALAGQIGPLAMAAAGLAAAVCAALLLLCWGSAMTGGRRAGDALCVAYAPDNESVVLPMIAGEGLRGRRFRSGGDIETAAGLVVMCSPAAFQSDRVKRALYLADRHRKLVWPVFIEQAEPPEDFEYFFAGAQPLDLCAAPAADRRRALYAMLGAR